MSCENCQWRARAQAKPDSLLSRLWRWHTGWCPGWRRYQAHLAAQGRSAGGENDRRDGPPRV